MGAFFLICKAKLSFIPNFIYMYMLNTIPIIYLTKLYFNILYRIPFSSQLFYQQYFFHLTLNVFYRLSKNYFYFSSSEDSCRRLISIYALVYYTHYLKMLLYLFNFSHASSFRAKSEHPIFWCSNFLSSLRKKLKL